MLGVLNRADMLGDLLVWGSDGFQILEVNALSLLCFDGCEVVAVPERAAAVESVDPFGGADF